MNKQLVVAYKHELKGAYVVTSANSMIAALNYFLRMLDIPQYRIKQFTVQKRMYCPEEKELTKKEYSRLIKAARMADNRRLELMMQTICATGIRVSELKFITVEAVEAGYTMVTCKRKSRTVFLPGKLRKLLKKYCYNDGMVNGPVFITHSGKAVDRNNIWREMKALCHKANVSHRKVFPHNLRHLFARTFYRAEKDITKLADILGHTNISTTRIYIMESGAEHRKQIERLQLVL